MLVRSLRSRFRWWLKLLFLSSLMLSLWLGQRPLASQVIPSQVRSVAAVSQAEQLVNQGVDRYKQGNIVGAIDPWQKALALYQTEQNLPHQAIVLENLARAYQSLGQASESLRYWQQTVELYRQLENLPQLGRMLTEQAQAYTRLGQHRRAIAILCGDASATDASATDANPSGSNPSASSATDASATDANANPIASNPIASNPLTVSCEVGSAIDIAQEFQDQGGTIAALGSLGDAYRQIGDYDQTRFLLTEALRLSAEMSNSAYQAALLDGLGQTATSLAQRNYRRASSIRAIGDTEEAKRLELQGAKDDAEALKFFRDSLTIAQAQQDWMAQVRALIDIIPAAFRTKDRATVSASLQQAISLLDRLPNAQNKVYAAIDLARLLKLLNPEQSEYWTSCWLPDTRSTALQLLQQATALAQEIGDLRSQSFAFGELGRFYECQPTQATEALALTQQARQAAEQDPDSRYLWEWQMGRILKQQNRPTAAIAAYEAAIATIESIRGDILTVNRDIQFDFRDTIEPIYRQLVELRLTQSEPATLISAREPAQTNLNATLRTLDSLKLAELQNYFGNDCVLRGLNNELVTLVGAETATAVFSSIILSDRTAIVVTFPDGRIQFEWIEEKATDLRAELNEYRRRLERKFDFQYDTASAQALYQKLIAPFASTLEAAKVNTLVFVQDGILRSVPMAALHDGEQYLIQKYAIATTPSLRLTDPKSLDRGNLRALAVGLTQAVTVGQQTFPALTHVENEINQVQKILPNSDRLLNQDFTRARIQKELDRNDFSIVHVATHGEFGTEPQDTFLVTGDSQKLTFNDLDRLLRRLDPDNPIQLLALTACQTAVGDDRAALGLAGAAAQAGTRSVLASLWFIDDATTAELVTQFYQGIQNQPHLSKAAALRAAQNSIIAQGGLKANPAYWAPFILIGNWL